MNMANLLHIIPQPEKALREANRVLRPGGSIIVIGYTMDGMKLLHKAGMIFRYLKTWGKPSPHARTLTLAVAGYMFTKQGFEIVQSELLGTRSKAIFIRAIKIDGPLMYLKAMVCWGGPSGSARINHLPLEGVDGLLHLPLVMHPLSWVVLGAAGYLVYRAGKKAGKKEPEGTEQEVKKT